MSHRNNSLKSFRVQNFIDIITHALGIVLFNIRRFRCPSVTQKIRYYQRVSKVQKCWNDIRPEGRRIGPAVAEDKGWFGGWGWGWVVDVVSVGEAAGGFDFFFCEVVHFGRMRGLVSYWYWFLDRYRRIVLRRQ